MVGPLLNRTSLYQGQQYFQHFLSLVSKAPRFQASEQDLVVLQHKFVVVEWRNRKKVLTITSLLLRFATINQAYRTPSQAPLSYQATQRSIQLQRFRSASPTVWQLSYYQIVTRRSHTRYPCTIQKGHLRSYWRSCGMRGSQACREGYEMTSSRSLQETTGVVLALDLPTNLPPIGKLSQSLGCWAKTCLHYSLYIQLADRGYSFHHSPFPLFRATLLYVTYVIRIELFRLKPLSCLPVSCMGQRTRKSANKLLQNHSSL